MTLSRIVLVFVFYSAFGWILEVSYSFAVRRKFVNRGFLYGPLCPIYGAGGILVTGLLRPLHPNVFLLFLATGLMTSVLEYAVSYTLEKLFKTTWWDYSDRKYNIRGRVCLRSSVAFGVVGVVVVKLLHPFVLSMIARMTDDMRNTVAVSLVIAIAVDLAMTLLSLRIAENKQRRFEVCFALSGLRPDTVFIN